MAENSGVTLLYLIKQVELAARSHLEDVVNPYGLTSIQYTALTVLERHPDLTSAQLARNSFVRAQTMAQMVTFLVSQDLVSRQRDENNRRQFKMRLTDKGVAVLDALRGRVADIEQQIVVALGESRTEELRTSLRDCRIALAGGGPR